jgi:hypothetical protein
VQRQINDTVRMTNNEMLSNFSDVITSKLADMQKSINEKQLNHCRKTGGKIQQVMSDVNKLRWPSTASFDDVVHKKIHSFMLDFFSEGANCVGTKNDTMPWSYKRFMNTTFTSIVKN